MKLVLVESPTKANAISQYLGNEYLVLATKGHIAEIRKRPFGVDIESGFTPHYELVAGAQERLREIRDAAAQAETVYLATDPDREGEAISWHLCRELQTPPEKAVRVEFHEITKAAVIAAMQRAHTIDLSLVDAYQARSVLDYVIGLTLSPLLSSKICRGLSGGRVQSAVLHEICERDRAIDAFIPEESWSVEAAMEKNGVAFTAKAVPEEFDADSAQALAARLAHVSFRVTEVKHQERNENPQPPFTTSTLQQDAASRLGFNVDRTMHVAQDLFEGVRLPDGEISGLITYMRTDSVRISGEAVEAARHTVVQCFGAEYLPECAPTYTAAANAQDAHEAIRPTQIDRTPESLGACLTEEQSKLYRLIYARFLASQMRPARRERVSVKLDAAGQLFQCGSGRILFDGFRKAYAYFEENGESNPESDLPRLQKDDLCQANGIECVQHFTQPPAHYTQASMVKYMEQSGIGRPSTYASTIKKVLGRGYAELDGRSLKARPLGMTVDDRLTGYFSDIVDTQYTRGMEEQLDQVAAGSAPWTDMVNNAWQIYAPKLAQARETMPRIQAVPTDKTCPICHAPLVKRLSKNGWFLGCSNYPVCNHAEDIPELSQKLCPACGERLEKRHKRSGTAFEVCVNPACERFRPDPDPVDPPQTIDVLSWARTIQPVAMPLSARKLANRITAAAPDGQSINGVELSQKFAEQGLLAGRPDAYGNRRMLPTPAGEAQGIGIKTTGAGGDTPMEVAVFNTDAQRYVLQHLKAFGFHE